MKKVIIAITFLLVGTSFANARDTIHIVGSSTVFPFSTAVAEAFGKKNKFPTPIVESTGSGGGLKLFCKGIGSRHPDITNASRRIKNQEVKRCAENGILDITEVKIGFDGIASMSLLWYNKDTSAVREELVDLSWMQKAESYWEDLYDRCDTLDFIENRPTGSRMINCSNTIFKEELSIQL